ncbi:3'-5' exoribonuclease YhaM family protein [Alkaliphilus crotonatoxidans]
MLIRQLKEIDKRHLNQQVEVVAMVVELKIKTTKNDKKYADFTLQDASKRVEAKCWDYEENQDFLQELRDSEILRLTVLVGEYQGQLQLTVKQMARVAEGQVKVEDLLPVSDWGIETLKKGLIYFYEKVEAPHLRELLDRMIFNETYFEKFITYPAARQVHHNFYNGLLQHVLEVLKFSYSVAMTKKLSQRQIDRLIVMGLLHDWAKIYEYKPLPAIGFTEEGTMLGHIFLGAHETLNVINQIEDFNQEDKLIILNGILGHHGKLEYGSPVLPKTVEAQILHHADKMSGDIESILSFMKEEEAKEEPFTGKLWNMGTEYYKKG